MDSLHANHRRDGFAGCWFATQSEVRPVMARPNRRGDGRPWQTRGGSCGHGHSGEVGLRVGLSREMGPLELDVAVLGLRNVSRALGGKPLDLLLASFLPYRRKTPTSTTALLVLLMTHAMELLHSQSVDEAPALLSGDPLHRIDDDRKPFLTSVNGNLTFPLNKVLIERAVKLSVFSAGKHRCTA
ncbi:hypothetical protein FH972_012493 [Carpinus fangiana]|uniref:Uncharacterized protein n=1 Tax=Carpinus fangiana TaxID=176857 RepID=A0A5N6R7B2_9ROSI|nr:hypothetical protein FH972_012493 [Carpinus fangiana]